MNPLVGSIGFGVLLFVTAFYIIPNPNGYSNSPLWPHKWVHVYCSHVLLWMYLDQAEKGCHPGPESRHSMNDLQMLVKYPIYERILNTIPYAYPVIIGLLIILVLPRWVWAKEERERRIMKIKPSGNLLLGCLILFLIFSSICYIIFLG